MENSKWKGNLGELKAATEFVQSGITVSFPFGDNARYDMIIDIDGELKKVQVKYSDSSTDNDSFVCRCTSSKNHTTNKVCDTYIDDIDYFVFYLPEINTCCLVPIEVIGNKTVFTLRNSIPKNNQVKGINFIKDYTFEKILKKDSLEI